MKHNAKDQHTQQAQGGVNGPIAYLFYDYDEADVRRDITCVPYDWSAQLVNGNAHVTFRAINKWCFGKLRYEWMNRIVTSTNDDGVNFQYMRLADIYLMAAEAENELNGPTQAAYDAIIAMAEQNKLDTTYCPQTRFRPCRPSTLPASRPSVRASTTSAHSSSPVSRCASTTSCAGVSSTPRWPRPKRS